MEQLFNIDSRLITAADSSMQNLRRVRGNDRLEEYFSFDVIINKFVSLNHMSLWFRPITYVEDISYYDCEIISFKVVALFPCNIFLWKRIQVLFFKLSFSFEGEAG